MTAWSEEAIIAIANAIYAKIQDHCYTNQIGVVDGIMSYSAWIECAENALSAISNSKEVREWRPISEAPKDGTDVMVYQGKDGNTLYVEVGEIGIARWTNDGFGEGKAWIATNCCDGVTRYDPTHFQYLPTPPTEADND